MLRVGWGLSACLLFVGIFWGCTRSQGIDFGETNPPVIGTEIPPWPPIHPNHQYNHLWVQDKETDFLAWATNGTGIVREGNTVRLELAPRQQHTLGCDPASIDGGTAHFDTASGLCLGTEPTVAGLPSGVSYYNGGSFYFGTALSPEVTPRIPIDHLIASWNAQTSVGTWLQFHVRLKIGNEWSRFYKLPIWASDETKIKRHSVKEAADEIAVVDTDTLALRKLLSASSYQLSVTLFSEDGITSPSLSLVSVVASRDRNEYPFLQADVSAFDIDLAVPKRSQTLSEYQKPEYQPYGGGGQAWCSPTSTSMVMEYFSRLLGASQLNRTVPEVAIGCYDWVYKGTGNWPFNTAYANLFGLKGYVTRLYSFAHAEPWLKAGIPLIISISFKAGELPGSPISKSNGHLIVVRGFDHKGDVLVNDPAAPDNNTVARTYPRAALEAAWAHSHRTAYVIFPKNWADVPAQD